MFKRSISVADVRHVLLTGEVIEDCPDDFPYPSRLLLGWSGIRPIHVVAAYDVQGDQIIVVTAYEPDPGQWDTDFRRRS